MRVTLIDYTKNARELLILSKNTRHLGDFDSFEQILDLTERKKTEELEYVFNTISSSWEFVTYTFLFQEVTRAFTHQLVRHRVGTAFAQESLRVAPKTGFAFLIPDKIEKDQYQLAYYNNTMSDIQTGYNFMIDKGADLQDARGVLPTNVCTSILMKINLRALATMAETRLCVRASGEFQEAMICMKEAVSEVHPWAERVIHSLCVTKGVCTFPRFDCPLKKKYEHLKPIDQEIRDKVRDDLDSLTQHGYSPQPERSK